MPRAMLVLMPPLVLAVAGCRSDTLSRRDYALIAGRSYVVTGASSGFGRGVAEELGRHGGRVVLAARRGEVLEAVAATIRAGGGEALVVPTDVSDAAAMTRLAEAAVQRFGRIDVWINNAGIGAIGPFDRIPLADHDRIVDVNLKGVIHGSHLALNQFRRQGQGTLVNIASVEGEVPLAWHASYAATKHAIVGLDGALFQELRLQKLHRRIRISTVMPWAADTPYFTHTANYSGGTPRVYLMDPPQKVVAAIVKAAVKPRKRIAVGFKAKLALTGDRIAPGLAEHLGAEFIDHSQRDTAPPAPDTSGSLYRPLPEGTAVDGGVRARMRREDAAREAIRKAARSAPQQ